MSTPLVTFCGVCKVIIVCCLPCEPLCICAQNHLYSHWKMAILGGHGPGACDIVPCGVTYSGACCNVITRTDPCGNWFTNGFRVGGCLVITCSETPANDCTYTIVTLTNTVITVCTCACLTNVGADCTAQFTMDGQLSAGFSQAFSTTGGDPITATQNLSGYFFLTNGWRVRPAEKSQSYLVEGNLFVCGGGVHPFVNTTGCFNTFVAINTSAQSLTTSTISLSCSGVSAVVDAVWDEPTSNHTTSGTFGKLMSKLKTILTILFTK